ncbi:MAG: hypothetical protein QOH63_1289 [Acidobacteriota bacterium]|jgi:hypothetical protein|nr:hypothetical protein [Acidobacteriota bacterium]
MSKLRLSFHALALVVFTFAFSSMAQAQATRTWVSGVGDDANPCSRTAPCKTFAGAISKTADGGEIDCIDPGGFGTVTLTKSVTIDGGGTFASILAAGTNGVNVNDSASGAAGSKIVRLRNLSINGASTGLVGINYTSGKALYVENCQIFGFKAGNGNGINVNLVLDGGQLFVRDSFIAETSGDGIKVTTSTGQVKVNLDGVRVDKTLVGIHIVNNTSGYINNCRTSMNASHGIQVENNSSVNIDHSTAFANTGFGLQAGAGAPTVRISDVSIENNVGGGVNLAGGTVFTFGDNKIRGSGGLGDVNGGTLNGSTTKQ